MVRGRPDHSGSESSTPSAAQGRWPIRPPIPPDPRAAGVGEGALEGHGARPPAQTTQCLCHPEGPDQPSGTGDRRVPPPRDLEPVPGQKRPGKAILGPGAGLEKTRAC